MVLQKLETSSKQIQTPSEFTKIFLLEFTKELIKHSSSGEVFQLENIVKKEIKEKKDEIKIEQKVTKHILKERPLLPKKKIFPIPKIRTLPPPVRPGPRILTIPEQKLPAHLSYLKPTPNANVEIDLGKLNKLVKDPAVKIIEADPDEKVMVTGSMGRKPTGIILTKEDINGIIDKFSKAAKIPANEGVFRVVVGRLILSAIISEVVGSKFIIKKMFPIRKPMSNIPQKKINPKYQIMPPAPRMPQKRFMPPPQNLKTRKQFQ